MYMPHYKLSWYILLASLSSFLVLLHLSLSAMHVPQAAGPVPMEKKQ